MSIEGPALDSLIQILGVDENDSFDVLATLEESIFNAALAQWEWKVDDETVRPSMKQRGQAGMITRYCRLKAGAAKSDNDKGIALPTTSQATPVPGTAVGGEVTSQPAEEAETAKEVKEIVEAAA